ncbi:MAG TPA: hypothetical protein HA282_02030 [Nanoarchaeota archaeon]|nr:MAG: hypothetical protein QT01_C0002G0089 [archaeon GW2011_AR6]MBS3082681.1 hypothetical protein [Candidatus Pacearchaeota archaeon]HIH18217.1 hypothetical protein [Nanoarchaeota archaeon]HIH34332.1 hypothetical protein [Nanoarchaeota archaeon]HIH50911.1 hypothetical protein [Nanoarchaeota archaeon]
MDKAKAFKNSVFFAVFLVLVFASVYYVVALPGVSVVHVGNIGLPNATSTKVVSLSVGQPSGSAPNINRSNMSGTVTFDLNTTITISVDASNITNVSMYYNATVGPEKAADGITWALVGHNNTFNLSTGNGNLSYFIVWDTTLVADSNGSVVINITVRGHNGTGALGSFNVTSGIAYNITIDNTAPEVRLEGYAFDNPGVLFNRTHYRNNGTGIRFNFTALDTLQFIGTCNLETSIGGANVTNGTVIGSTDQLNVTRGISARIGPYRNTQTTGYVNLSDGIYNWNVRCNDTLGNAATNNTNYTLVIDATSPADVTLTVPASNHEFGSSTAAEIKCTNSDATALTNDTVVTITKPGGTKVIKRNHNSTHTSATFNFASGSDKELDELGTYKVDCAARDRAGNSGSAGQKTFTVSSGESAGGGGGGGSGSSAVGATYNLGTITSEGKTQLMAENGKATFTIAGSSHTATLTDVGTDSATIIVASDPVTLVLKIGETKKVDFETDAVYDLAIRLVSIIGNRANFEFKTISESYTPAAGEGQPTTGREGESTGTTSGGQEAGKAGASKALWWILGVIVLVIVITLVLKATKKKKR